MKKSLLTVAVSILLAAAVLAGAPAAQAATGGVAVPSPEPVAPESQALDLTKGNTLTLQLPSAFVTDNWTRDTVGEKTDPHQTGVQVDLYLVAVAAKIPGVDGYTFEEFQGEDDGTGELTTLYNESIDGKETLEAGTWEKMAQLAAKALFTGFDDKKICNSFNANWSVAGTANFGIDNDGKIAATADVVPANEDEKLISGLYLIVPHEPDASAASAGDVQGYARQVTTKDGTQIVTMAYSAYNEFMFKPALVSLPARGNEALEGEDEGFTGRNTAAENGAWQYAVRAMLKGDHQPRYGKLQITKTVENFIGTEPATFVFQVFVDAPKELGAAAEPGNTPEEGAEQLPYLQVGITVKPGDGPQTVVVPHIPVGSKVRVEELDTGDSFTLTKDDDSEQTIDVADIVGFEFTNTGDNENKNGSGVVNRFDATKEGWNWFQNSSETGKQVNGNAGNAG